MHLINKSKTQHDAHGNDADKENKKTPFIIRNFSALVKKITDYKIQQAP